MGLPALTRALKLQEKAGKVGFDWNDARAVIAKLREEIDEVEAEIEAGDAKAAGASAWTPAPMPTSTSRPRSAGCTRWGRPSSSTATPTAQAATSWRRVSSARC